MFTSGPSRTAGEARGPHVRLEARRGRRRV